MRLISHRGNLLGPGGDLKTLKDVQEFLDLREGYDIELDFWSDPFGNLQMGHEQDKATYVVIAPKPLSFPTKADSKWIAEHNNKRNRERHIKSFFTKYGDRIWCHAKNHYAVTILKRVGAKHIFMHDQDKAAMTSCGKIWSFSVPGVTEETICVVQNIADLERILYRDLYGICSDYIGTRIFKKLFGETK